MVFDETYAEVPSTTLDDDTVYGINNLFDEVMDGYLQDNYMLVEDGKIPQTGECLAEAIEKIPGAAFKLEWLAREMKSCGISDARAYKLIMSAIEEGIIIPSELDVITEEDLFIEEVEGLLKRKMNDEE
jgi:hypothetical protein